MSRAIIIIDGIDGSGKSTFARGLAAALATQGVRTVPISVDDFRRPIDWAAVASEPDVYYDGYYDLVRAGEVLEAFRSGALTADLPRFDPVAERSAGSRRVVFEGADAVILEGVFPLRVPGTAEALAIYLDTSAALARRRIVERDLKKGRTREEIERRIDRRYAPGQRRYHAAIDPRGRADVIIVNEEPAAPCCLRRELARVPAELRPRLDRALPPE